MRVASDAVEQATIRQYCKTWGRPRSGCRVLARP